MGRGRETWTRNLLVVNGLFLFSTSLIILRWHDDITRDFFPLKNPDASWLMPNQTTLNLYNETDLKVKFDSDIANRILGALCTKPLLRKNIPLYLIPQIVPQLKPGDTLPGVGYNRNFFLLPGRVDLHYIPALRAFLEEDPTNYLNAYAACEKSDDSCYLTRSLETEINIVAVHEIGAHLCQGIGNEEKASNLTWRQLVTATKGEVDNPEYHFIKIKSS